ncbi:MAG: cytochrome P450 [Nocardioides sp.]
MSTERPTEPSTELIDLLSPTVRADPYPTYAAMRRDSPVTEVAPGGMYAVSRFTDVRHVLRTPEVFASAGFADLFEPDWLDYNPIAHSMLAMDGGEHRALRKLVAGAFGRAAGKAVDGPMRAKAGELADRLVAAGQGDAVSEYALPFTAYVIGELLGLDTSVHGELKRWSDDFLSVNPVSQGPEHEARVRRTVTELTSYVDASIEKSRQSLSDGLVSNLIRTEVDGERLTDEQLREFLTLLLIGGLETSSHLIANSLLFLADNPEIWASLKADRSLVGDFVDEVLRHDSPMQALPRLATRESSLGGVSIPAGSLVLALLGSANRDADHHQDDPDSFRMGRAQPDSMSFGNGPHYCIGAVLTRLEGTVALEELLERVDSVSRSDAEVTWNQSITVRGPVSLGLEFRTT